MEDRPKGSGIGRYQSVGNRRRAGCGWWRPRVAARACRAERRARRRRRGALAPPEAATTPCGLLRDRAARRARGRADRPRGRGSTSAQRRAAPGRLRRPAPGPPPPSAWPLAPRRGAPPTPAPRRGGRRVRPRPGPRRCCASPASPSRSGCPPIETAYRKPVFRPCLPIARRAGSADGTPPDARRPGGVCLRSGAGRPARGRRPGRPLGGLPAQRRP